MYVMYVMYVTATSFKHDIVVSVKQMHPCYVPTVVTVSSRNSSNTYLVRWLQMQWWLWTRGLERREGETGRWWWLGGAAAGGAWLKEEGGATRDLHVWLPDN